MALRGNHHCIILTGFLFFNVPAVFGQTAREYIQNGNESYNQNNFDQAIYEYTKAIELSPNLSRAYNNRGVAYAQEGSFSRAIADFTMAIANNVNDAEAYNNRGHAYAEQGDLAGAVSDYSKAVAIDPVYIKAYKNRGKIYYQLKKYDKAWDDLFTIEKLGGKVDPDFYRSLRNAAK